MASKNNISRITGLVLAAGLLSLALPVGAGAQDQAIQPTEAVLRVTKATNVKPVKFDWLADRGPRLRPTLVSDVKTPRQIGSGSWICSPAGFGKKSRCYSN